MDHSPAGCAFVKNSNELTKLSEDEWEVNVYRSVDGGGTGLEYPVNLKKDGDSPGNKWYDYQSGETWIEGIFNEPTRIKFIQLKSANDCPERDPYKISFQMKQNEESDYKTLATFDHIIFKGRYQVLDFNIETWENVKSVRVVIHSNRSMAYEQHWGSGTQLAQMIFYR